LQAFQPVGMVEDGRTSSADDTGDRQPAARADGSSFLNGT
jgi:hypothetical protein